MSDLAVLQASALYQKGRPLGSLRTAWVLASGGTVEVSFAPGVDKVEYLAHFRNLAGGTEEVRGRIEVSWSRAGRTGRRAWLHCSTAGCRYRTDRLYVVHRELCCRHCAGVRYESKNRPAHLRARVKADRLRVRLGAEPGPLASLPRVRPKGMHRATFQACLDDLIKAERMYRELLPPVVDLHRARVYRRLGTILDSPEAESATTSPLWSLRRALEAGFQ